MSTEVNSSQSEAAGQVVQTSSFFPNTPMSSQGMDEQFLKKKLEVKSLGADKSEANTGTAGDDDGDVIILESSTDATFQSRFAFRSLWSGLKSTEVNSSQSEAAGQVVQTSSFFPNTPMSSQDMDEQFLKKNLEVNSRSADKSEANTGTAGDDDDVIILESSTDATFQSRKPKEDASKAQMKRRHNKGKKRKLEDTIEKKFTPVFMPERGLGFRRLLFTSIDTDLTQSRTKAAGKEVQNLSTLPSSEPSTSMSSHDTYKLLMENEPKVKSLREAQSETYPWGEGSDGEVISESPTTFRSQKPQDISEAQMNESHSKGKKRKLDEDIIEEKFTPIFLPKRYCLMQLNELKPGLVYNVERVPGPQRNQKFVVSVVVNGIKFVGSGKTKKLAKHDVAQAALSSILQFRNTPEVFKSERSPFTTDNVKNEGTDHN